MIVVSEIGEQWSPQTAPAIHAETQTTPIGVVIGKTLIVIGIRIPNVPQEVPVENDRKQPIRKMIAGSMTCRPAAEPSTRPETNSLAARL